MKLILRQAAFAALAFGLLYGVVLGITFLVAPMPPDTRSMNVWDAYDTLYLTTPKYAFLGRWVLDNPDPKVILVGASNTGLGFKQRQVQTLVPGARVSNLAIGGANISEVRQMIDLVHDVQSRAARRSDTFVIGVWFGMFVDSAQMWHGTDRHPGDTDLDIERYRYGFYRRTAAGPVAVLPPEWLRFGVTLIRPYLLLEKVARDVTRGLRDHLFARPPELTDADREKIVFSDTDRATALAYWRATMGNDGKISMAQVALLRDTIAGLLRSGEKVVLVDLPIPAWHQAASPFEPQYVRAIKAMAEQFAGRPGFAQLAMPDLDADADFSDEVHAKPHMDPIWAARLAVIVNPLLDSTENGTVAQAGARAPQPPPDGSLQ